MSARPPVATPKRYTWRSPKEIAAMYGVALVLCAFVYLWDGQSLLYWGAKTTAYYVGTTTEATVVAVALTCRVPAGL